MKKLLLLAVVVIGVAAVVMWRMRGPVLTLATATVTKGEFVDVVEIRGDVRPFKSTVLNAPMMAGDLQILKIVPNGATVKAGEVVLEFDGATLKRTIQEKQSELRQGNEELRQQVAQAGVGSEADRTALLHAGYDVERAKLGLGDEAITSKVDLEKGRLLLADAGTRLHEAEVKDAANRTATEKGFGAKRNSIAKTQADLDKAQKALDALQIKAPADGVVSVMYNWQMSSATSQEYRAGDKAYAGAQILELPDLSSVLLTARLDESDRGVLQAGQTAIIHLDAIPDRDYHASVTDVSLLARVDYSSWPPVKNFDLRLTFTDADARLRPGMSAAARIAVGHLPDMLLVPTETVFLVDGRARVYRLSASGRAVEPVIVDVVKRNKVQTAVKGPLKAGDKVTLTRPDAGEQAKK
jgi:multidrug efflux pump subunit AcrA (membrane-fusion protein)